MTEDAETAGGGVIDRKSSRGRRRRPVSDYIAIVRPPGDPTAIRVFARDELGQAQWFPITSQFSTTENEESLGHVRGGLATVLVRSAYGNLLGTLMV